MNHFFFGLSLLAFLLPSASFSADNMEQFLEEFNSQKKEYKLKYNLSFSQNKSLFQKYCKGGVSSHRPPEPRYSNSLVKKAAANIASTDRKAKEVLQQRARKRMDSEMNQALKLANGLKEESQSSAVKQQATALYNEINANDSFNDSMERKTKSISEELTKEVRNLVSELVEKLENDLQGIDQDKYKELINKLFTGIEADLEKVSFGKLKETNTKLREVYQEKVGSADKEKVKSLAEKISAECSISLEADPENWNFKYMKQSADSLSKEVAENGLTNSAFYTTTTILNYYEDENINHTESSVAYGKELAKQVVPMRAEYIVEVAKKLDEVLSSADESNDNDFSRVQSASNEMNYSLSDVSAWVFGESLKAVNEAFMSEYKKFDTKRILTRAKLAKDQANAGEWDNSYSQAESLMYNLKRREESLSENTKKDYLDTKAELAKLVSDRVKKTAKELDESLSEANDIKDELIWVVNDFSGYMERDLGLTTAKSAAEKYVLFAKDVQKAQDLKELTKSRLEDAKPGMHYYFYGHVWKHYKENGQKPSFVSWNAHKFLKQLCGEYRDRATMIEAKIKWVAEGLFILPTKEEATNSQITAQTKNVWSKVNASWYYPYLEVTGELWASRRRDQSRYIKVGSSEPEGEGRKIDNPVKGTTVCETKFIFAKYISQGKSFDSLEAYNQGYDDFKGGCPSADRRDYYDFRGDSNFKHYSPESNGMIWYANNLARACRSTNRVKSSARNYKSADCEKYFKNPFQMRYAGARALLASWLFRAPEHDEVFGNSGSMVSIYSHRNPQLLPYSFGFDQNTLDYHFQFDPDWLGIPLENSWLKGDMGYNEYTGLAAGSQASDEAKDRAFTLISNAVDRHTDWYASGYNDGNGFVRDQATSPFVASSYVMSSSDAFTTCGTTVQCPPDGLKRWMFVFRVKGDNWYGPDRIEKGEAINFDRHWFDETSFGFTSLADHEHAWDRLGTALEEELDSILYLVNVSEGESFHDEDSGF